MRDMSSAPTAFGQKDVISKKELKPFMRRSDLPGLINFAGHMLALMLTGSLIWLALGSWWILPAMMAHGIVLVFLFAPVHECSHGTAFKTRWLNEMVFNIVSFLYLVQPTIFRYAHAAHHTYTNIRDWDPDIFWPQNATIRDYLWYCTSLPVWSAYLGWPIRHAFRGDIDEDAKYYIPHSEIPRIVREARIHLAIYTALAITSIIFGVWQQILLFWIIPRFMGEPFMRWIRVAEHAECEESGDLRKNTRTTKTSRLVYFLFWNMPYHAEHHICPQVPFHALPKLHTIIRDRLHPEGENYPAVHGEVLGKLANKTSVTWQTDGSSSL